MKNIFHIVQRAEFEGSALSELYRPASFNTEGFIHCSYLEQVCAVANERFTGESGLVLLEIDPASTGCDVVDEDLYGLNEWFPHIYGALPTRAIIAVHEFEAGSDGTFNLPTPLNSHYTSRPDGDPL